MPQIVAWKCRKTGLLFEEKNEFSAHLCKRAFERGAEAKKAARLEQLRSAVWEMREMTSFVELEHWLNSNTDLLFALACEANPRARQTTKHAHRLWDIQLKNMTFAMIRTTHAAPIGRKTTGWSKDSPAVAFPAFRGRIDFRQENFPSFASDIWRATPINTGSGGGGSPLSYEVTLFFEDFPFMVDMMHREGRLDPAIPYPPPFPPWLALEDA